MPGAEGEHHVAGPAFPPPGASLKAVGGQLNLDWPLPPVCVGRSGDKAVSAPVSRRGGRRRLYTGCAGQCGHVRTKIDLLLSGDDQRRRDGPSMTGRESSASRAVAYAAVAAPDLPAQVSVDHLATGRKCTDITLGDGAYRVSTGFRPTVGGRGETWYTACYLPLSVSVRGRQSGWARFSGGQVAGVGLALIGSRRRSVWSVTGGWVACGRCARRWVVGCGSCTGGGAAAGGDGGVGGQDKV